MKDRRIARLQEQIKQTLAQVLLRDLADPKLGMVTITRIELDSEFTQCKAYWSVLGDEKQQQDSAGALRRARGLCQRAIGKAVHARTMPHLEFVFDQGIGGAIRLNALIDELAAERRKKEAARGEVPHPTHHPICHAEAKGQDMVFSSSEFLFGFLPAFLLLYGLCPRVGRSLLIALASFVFYGWWEPWFVLLLFGSSALDFWIGRRIAAAQALGQRGRGWLWLSVTANLSLLGWFKYANFGVATFRALLQSLGWQGELAWVDVVLPVGISFYTFQTLSYTIDLYRGEVRPARSFVDFLCYVAMFPQLVAGPIVRYAVVERELTERQHSLAAVRHGVLLFQIGLCKKLLLADALAPLADSAFGAAEPGSLGALGAWLGVLAYAFQIYFDFSGYSDMAIGLGRMLGFHFPINFDAPYKSASITEFWRRWHISLSTWLRDYLYVPLGGNRKGPVRTYVNLALTMLLGGLWHGAAWNFVAWGAYQGGWLIVERRLGKRSWYGPLPLPLRILLTFALVLVGWVFFRARDLGHAVDYLRAMAGSGGAGLALDASAVWIELLAAALVVWFLPTSQRLANTPRWWFVLLLQPLFVLAALHLRAQPENVPFLYFRF